MDIDLLNQLKSETEQDGECWVWKGRSTQGLQFSMGKFLYSAPRMSYAAYYRVPYRIIKRKNVVHKCGNDRCINPEHLEINL